MRYTYVIYLTIWMGNVHEEHAIGFINQANCWEWVELFNKDLKPGRAWMGFCKPMEEFLREYPGVEIENDS